ncbi:hypothetical protein [Oceanobacillus oncorhynchi]|uniref:hypothetical protein n=1 Tax=Oceanobacillus oncorhynchi TaxID=545501 RepID=UPI0018686D57|nr:hypothetical protein [Oceanobacillus oncorhynchi]
MMGVMQNISVDSFPRQGDYLYKRAKVCFNYDTSETINGTIIRDDREHPFLTLIRLDNGRIILSSECQHTVPE